MKSEKDVAAHFKVTVRTVNKWKKRADPMPWKPGQFNLNTIATWRAKSFTKGKDQQVIDPDATEESKERTEHQKLQHDINVTKWEKEKALTKQNQIKALRMDDEFIPLEQIRNWVSDFLTLQRNLLASIPVDMFASAEDEHRKIYQPDLKVRLDIHSNQMADWMERVEDLRGAE